MSIRRLWAFALIVAVVLGLAASSVSALPGFARKTGAACASCHANVAGGADLTDAGKAFKADQSKVPAAGTANEYLGAGRCKVCHSKQFKAWSSTPHATALASLSKADSTTAAAWAKKMSIELTGTPMTTEACVTCHVTAEKLAGGYPAADSLKNAELSLVGCEACHGPGSAHKAAAKEQRKAMINSVVGATLCKSCHTAEASPEFNFEEWCKKVHPVPAAQ